MKLPENFTENMKELLGEYEFSQFINSLDTDRFYGLKVNTLKIRVEEFVKQFPYFKEPIYWAKDAFYYSFDDLPTQNPLYNLGLYYIQEPSAMIPATILAPKPYEYVLDLCAAPGGKSLQLACSMQNTGLLVCNDISEKRVKPLVRNVEFYGIRNCVVTNETPQKLSNKFPKFFDKILVDAPCSGEGMFKKDKEALKSYAKYSIEVCTKMQNEILHYADLMLKDQGVIVYSTCTFNPDENERMIYNFSKKYGYNFLNIPKIGGMESGRQHWCYNEPEVSKTARIWPHKAKGEGHFVAMLQKDYSIEEDISNQEDCATKGYCFIQEDSYQRDSSKRNSSKRDSSKRDSSQRDSSQRSSSQIDKSQTDKSQIDKSQIDRYQRGSSQRGSSRMCDSKRTSELDIFEEILGTYRCFEKENFNMFLEGEFFSKDFNLYFLPSTKIDFENFKIAKYGLFLGQYRNGDFEPSHSLLITLKRQDIKNTVSINKNSNLLIKYLKGETLVLEGQMEDLVYIGSRNGLVALCVEDFPVGWGKLNDQILKNLYPKGWRK